MRPQRTETLRLAGAASTLGLDAYVGHTISATGALAKTDPPVTPGIVPAGSTARETPRPGPGPPKNGPPPL